MSQSLPPWLVISYFTKWGGSRLWPPINSVIHPAHILWTLLMSQMLWGLEGVGKGLRIERWTRCQQMSPNIMALTNTKATRTLLCCMVKCAGTRSTFTRSPILLNTNLEHWEPRCWNIFSQLPFYSKVCSREKFCFLTLFPFPLLLARGTYFNLHGCYADKSHCSRLKLFRVEQKKTDTYCQYWWLLTA